MGKGLCYYDILGVPRSANDVEIKKAYRRLALKYHPEADPSHDGKQEFARICEAYDVLSSPMWKGGYDLYGENKLKEAPLDGNSPYSFDAETGPARVFSRFFGTNNPFEALNVLAGHFEALTTTQKKEAGQTRTYDLYLTMEELYHGATKQLQHMKRHTGEMGETSLEQRTLAVTVAPGTLDGTAFVYPGEGDSTHKQPAGDVVVTVSSAPHPRYQRAGSDLVHRVKLPLAQALIGGLVNVATLDGRTLQVPLPEIITPGHTLRVPGEGMLHPDGSGIKGDLQLVFDLLFPSHLTQQQKMLIKAGLLLPGSLDEDQAKALRSFEGAFKHPVKGWCTGVTKEAAGGGQ